MPMINLRRVSRATLPEGAALCRSHSAQLLRGPAELVWPDGRHFPVEARLSRRRSRFSVWGSGEMYCDDDVGFDALARNTWLSLVFGDKTTVGIDVYDLKGSDGQCRCLFTVRS